MLLPLFFSDSRRAAQKSGFVGLRDRTDAFVQVIAVVLGATLFFHRSSLHPPVTLDRRPRHVEGARVVDRHGDLQRLAVFDQSEALHDMDLARVRRAIIVDEGPVVQPDRVDDQRVAFVMADRLAVPAGRRMRRMRHIQIDMPCHRILLDDHQNLFGTLDEINRDDARIDQEAGNASRPAPLPRDERDLSGEHLFVGFAHLVHGPGHQNGIGEIGDPVGRLFAQAVGNIGMGFIGHHGAGPAGRRKKVVAREAVRDPSGACCPEPRSRIALFSPAPLAPSASAAPVQSKPAKIVLAVVSFRVLSIDANLDIEVSLFGNRGDTLHAGKPKNEETGIAAGLLRMCRTIGRPER